MVGTMSTYAQRAAYRRRLRRISTPNTVSPKALTNSTTASTQAKMKVSVAGSNCFRNAMSLPRPAMIRAAMASAKNATVTTPSTSTSTP